MVVASGDPFPDREKISAMRYLVEVGGSESPFTYEADTAPKAGDTIFNRREGVADAYIVRLFEPSHDDFDGVIKADWTGQVGPARGGRG